MTNRIDAIFAEHRAAGRKALMPFITGGYPSLEVTAAVLPRLEQAGASIVEIGFPFSDPIADGPVIAASMHEALEQGVTPGTLFDTVRSVRDAVSLGLVAMVSESIIDRMGADAFVTQAATAGFDGLIVPDADTDPDAAHGGAHIARVAHQHGLTCTFLIAPTTDVARVAGICALCSGFVYLLARVGITGERDTAPEVAERVATVREHTDLPIAVGFGISRADHVRAVTQHADAAIVGTALVRRMGDAAASADNPATAAETFVTELAAGLDGAD